VLKTAQKYYYYLVFRHTYISIDGCEINLVLSVCRWRQIYCAISGTCCNFCIV